MKLVNTVIDHGINFFDTANVYIAGQSEEILGKELGTKRNSVIIATKVRGRVCTGDNDAGFQGQDRLPKQ